ADRAHRARRFCGFGQLAVGDRGAVRDGVERGPYAPPEVGAVRGERQVELAQLTGEVGLELALRISERGRVAAPLGAHGHGAALVRDGRAGQRDAAVRRLLSGEGEGAEGAVDGGVEGHAHGVLPLGVPVLGPVWWWSAAHRWWRAYERQGRHASAAAEAVFGLPSTPRAASPRRTPTSVGRKTSGSPSARIRMYPVV